MITYVLKYLEDLEKKISQALEKIWLFIKDTAIFLSDANFFRFLCDFTLWKMRLFQSSVSFFPCFLFVFSMVSYPFRVGGGETSGSLASSLSFSPSTFSAPSISLFIPFHWIQSWIANSVCKDACYIMPCNATRALTNESVRCNPYNDSERDCEALRIKSYTYF